MFALLKALSMMEWWSHATVSLSYDVGWDWSPWGTSWGWRSVEHWAYGSITEPYTQHYDRWD